MEEAQSHHQDRVWFLLEQKRFHLAEKELRALLALNPQDGWAHAHLAWCLCVKGEWNEALSAAIEAVGLAPEDALCHRAHGFVLRTLGRFAEAERAILEGIRLAPSWSVLFGDLASIYQGQNRWNEQLIAADRGLGHDPNDELCLMLRGAALVFLGRSREGIETFRRALDQNPEDAQIHELLGWALENSNRYGDAFRHYSEALRLDPNSDSARKGVIDAFKGKNPFRWPLISWLRWSHKAKPLVFVIFLVALFFLIRFISELTDNSPELKPLFGILTIALVVFIVDFCLGNPLFEVMFLANPFWRIVQNQREKWKSMTLAGAIFVSLICFSLCFWNPWFLVHGFCMVCCLYVLVFFWKTKSKWFRWLLGVILAVSIILQTITFSVNCVSYLKLSESITVNVNILADNLDDLFVKWTKTLFLFANVHFLYNQLESRKK